MIASFTETASIIAQLDRAGLRAMAFKGCVFAALIHNDPSARSSQDIDLLIAPTDRKRAVATLEALGYVARPRSNGLIREIHLVKEVAACVDLHWNPAGASTSFPLNFERLWQDRQHVRHGTDNVPYPANPWLVVFTALFILRKLPMVEARYVDDLSALIDRFPSLDWCNTRTVAEESRAVLLTTVGLHLSAELTGRTLPAGALSQFPLTARAERLIDDIEGLFRNEQAQARHEFVSEIGALLGISRFREHWIDRIYPFAVFPLILLLPDDKDAERAANSGRSVWWERAARVPEVFHALVRHLHQRRERARFVRSLARTDTVVTLAPHASLHLIGQEGLVLQAKSQALLALNTAAAWIWCQLEDDHDLGELTIGYGETFGVEQNAVAGIVHSVLLDWWDRGLIDGAPYSTAPVPEPVGFADWNYPIPAADQRGCYRILDQLIQIGMPRGEPATRIGGLLGHFADHGPPTHHLDVVRERSGFAIIREGQIIERAPLLLALGPQVKCAALVTAINAQPFELYLHAAMLCRDGEAILLPAAPGSGKTCLSAALSQRGFRYHTDEITLLVGEHLHARGIPTALTVKERAWPVLTPMFPGLRKTKVHHRIDGRICRYLPPPIAKGDPDLDKSWPVRALVFPRFDAEAPTKIERLTKVEALRRVLSECLAIQGGLDAQRVERLMHWIEAVEAYSLRFRSFDDAASALAEVGLMPVVRERQSA